MNAGKLKSQVTIEQPTREDVYGEQTSSWSTLATVWAQVLPGASREVYRQSQVVAGVSYVVRIRYRTDVTADMRIVWGPKTLQIAGQPFEEMVKGSRLLNIPCTESDNG